MSAMSNERNPTIVPYDLGTQGSAIIRPFMHKANAYGLHMKQEIEIEIDYDLLHREWVLTSNQCYAIKSLHAKVDSGHPRTAEIITTVGA